MGRGPDVRPRKPRQDGMRPPPNLAGRPKGTKNVLVRGAIETIRSLRYRVPVGTPEAIGVLADEALATTANVLLHSGKGAMARLAAAKLIREEACGPVAQRFEHSGPGGGPIQTEDVKARLRDRLLGRLVPKAGEGTE